MPVKLDFVPAVPNYRFGTTLDGIPYIFDVRWNGRDRAWYFDLLEEDETIIITGITVVLGAILDGRSAADSIPLGAIIAADLASSGTDATFDDIGDRVGVYFYTAAELDALL